LTTSTRPDAIHVLAHSVAFVLILAGGQQPRSARDDCQDTDTVAVLVENGQAGGAAGSTGAGKGLKRPAAYVAKGCRLAHGGQRQVKPLDVRWRPE
jgi:hypothetical protein